MKKFREFSSLTINVEKCEASWIGRAKNRTSKPIRCKWSSLTKNCIKILGIQFSSNKALAEKENFYTLSLDCCALLNSYLTFGNKDGYLWQGKFRFLNLWLHPSQYTLPL